MSIPLYFDVHIPRAVLTALRQAGVDVLTAQEDGRRRAGDPELLNRATELGRALVTQDEDLLSEAAARQSAGVEFAGVFYSHQLRITPSQLSSDLILVSTVADPEYIRNRVEWLPLQR